MATKRMTENNTARGFINLRDTLNFQYRALPSIHHSPSTLPLKINCPDSTTSLKSVTTSKKSPHYKGQTPNAVFGNNRCLLIYKDESL